MMSLQVVETNRSKLKPAIRRSTRKSSSCDSDQCTTMTIARLNTHLRSIYVPMLNQLPSTLQQLRNQLHTWHVENEVHLVVILREREVEQTTK